MFPNLDIILKGIYTFFSVIKFKGIGGTQEIPNICTQTAKVKEKKKHEKIRSRRRTCTIWEISQENARILTNDSPVSKKLLISQSHSKLAPKRDLKISDYRRIKSNL